MVSHLQGSNPPANPNNRSVFGLPVPSWAPNENGGFVSKSASPKRGRRSCWLIYLQSTTQKEAPAKTPRPYGWCSKSGASPGGYFPVGLHFKDHPHRLGVLGVLEQSTNYSSFCFLAFLRTGIAHPVVPDFETPLNGVV